MQRIEDRFPIEWHFLLEWDVRQIAETMDWLNLIISAIINVRHLSFDVPKIDHVVMQDGFQRRLLERQRNISGGVIFQNGAKS